MATPAKPRAKEFMNMICAEGVDMTKISLTSGHTTIVYAEPTPVEKIFWKKAMDLGCSPEGARIHMEPEAQPPSQHELLVADIRRFAEEFGADGMGASGVPDLKKLRKFVGRNLTQIELQKAWLQFVEEEDALDAAENEREDK